MEFRSDNTVGAAPEVIEAMAAANTGAAMGYGDDAWTERVEARLAEIFERRCTVLLVSTGTAANALSLAALTPPWGAVFCDGEAHIEVDECGAPEFYTGGAKLLPLPSADGKITEAALRQAIAARSTGAVHNVRPKALSLTQATEAGTIYTPDEITALSSLAHTAGLKTHLDGTRFANALARSGASPAAMSWKAGVDVLCLGATKNGAVAAEAILCFDEALAEDLAYRRKRGGHLLSKMRFVAAQLEAWLAGDLWLRLAAHANAMADRLAAGLGEIEGVVLRHAVGANMLHVALPIAAHRALQAAGAEYYVWQSPIPEDATDLNVRLVCSFETTAEEVDQLIAIVAAS